MSRLQEQTTKHPKYERLDEASTNFSSQNSSAVCDKPGIRFNETEHISCFYALMVRRANCSSTILGMCCLLQSLAVENILLFPEFYLAGVTGATLGVVKLD